MNTIWVITVFTDISADRLGQLNSGSRRTWGFYTKYADALAALESNMTDLFETCYDWAVLEEYEPGIAGFIPGSTQWFKYDEERDGYFFDKTKTTQLRNCGAIAMEW